MNAFDAAQIAAALGAGSVLPWLVRRLRRDPKSEAEARKINADADDRIVGRLYREIDRLDAAMDGLLGEFASFKKKAEDRERGLENENRSLRSEVARLRKRVEDLEEIITTKTTPEEMRAQLAEIDRKTREPKE